MEYGGYLTKKELFNQVEKYFPFIKKPSSNELYIVDESDVIRRIIESNLVKYTEIEFPYDGVMILYDEFSTISQKAVEWMFPSLLRIIVKGADRSNNLHWCLPSYVEHMNLDVANSAYNFSWLSFNQRSVLQSVLEYISEEYGVSTAEAQFRLSVLA